MCQYSSKDGMPTGTAGLPGCVLVGSSALIERDISPDAAWRVVQDERGRLRWVSSAGTVTKQPALGLLQRVTAFFINWLPLESQA